MSPAEISENFVEDVAIGSLESAGIRSRVGSDLSEAGLYPDRGLIGSLLRDAILRLNPHLQSDKAAVEQVVGTLRSAPHPTFLENNRWFHKQLVDGVEVEYTDAKTKERRGTRAQLLDFDRPTKNDFLVVRQLSIATACGGVARPDLVLFVNGLPLVVIELKDPTNTEADLRSAHGQLHRYRDTIPDLLIPNTIVVASDGLLTRVGSVTSPWSRFAPWRASAGAAPTLEGLIRDVLTPDRLLDYLQTCIVFEEDERGEIVKKVAGYHQFRAVRKGRTSVLEATEAVRNGEANTNGGRGGVVWHTQGSGKSLTMLMLSGALIREPRLKNPTIVVVTDRNDLDQQLFDTFAGGRELLRQTPVMAESREHLSELLDRAAGGVVFTTIHKFADAQEKVSERSNIIVMADEAHRSQYGFADKKRLGAAHYMRQALPNATFLGFTGTPIDRRDASTPRVFGDYVDVYDVRQSVEDGATVPIFYEPRIVKLTVDEKGVAEVEKLIAELAEADEEGLDVEERVKVQQRDLLAAPERVERLAAFIVDHWEKRRAAIEGKAMVVVSSRDMAARLYDELAKLRPEWHADDDSEGEMKVVITGGSDDPELLQRHTRGKAERKKLAERFKKGDSDFRVAIVCDMWLTGFDVPAAHTMYLDKPLKEHNLMQAIARVNRVWGDKPGGLIVDTINLTDELADALATYADAAGSDTSPVQNVQDEAIPVMQEAFKNIRDFFAGFDYTEALGKRPKDILRLYADAANYVHAQDGTDKNGNPSDGDENPGWKRFRDLVKRLSTAFALAVPREETEAIAPHLSFYQNLAAAIRKRLADYSGSGAPRQTDVDLAVRQVLGGAVDAGDVIDLFAVAGLEDARLDVLSDEFLGRVAQMEQKNLALETLRKLLADQIRASQRRNLVQSRKFREALEDAMLLYTNKQISTAEMIARLIEIAKLVREERARGETGDMTEDELAFYDALAENGSAREVMKSDDLRLMARKLTDMVAEMPKLDWTQRESVRADLRRKVRRILAMYGYPPDLSEDATQLVLKQAELSTDNQSTD
ncbi:MAG: type I restriction endonuclease subunit R [Phycisphaerales bacterium]